MEAPPVARRPPPEPAAAEDTGDEQRRGEAALADIHYPWQSTGYEIVFLPGSTDYAAGDFAETFAYRLLGSGSFRSELAPPPSSAQLEELAPLFQPS